MSWGSLYKPEQWVGSRKSGYKGAKPTPLTLLQWATARPRRQLPSAHLPFLFPLIISYLFQCWAFLKLRKSTGILCPFPHTRIPGLKAFAPGSDPRDADSPGLSENPESFLESVASAGLAWKPVGFILPAQVWWRVSFSLLADWPCSLRQCRQVFTIGSVNVLPSPVGNVDCEGFCDLLMLFHFGIYQKSMEECACSWQCRLLIIDYSRISDPLSDFRLWTWSLDPGYLDF